MARKLDRGNDILRNSGFDLSLDGMCHQSFWRKLDDINVRLVRRPGLDDEKNQFPVLHVYICTSVVASCNMEITWYEARKPFFPCRKFQVVLKQEYIPVRVQNYQHRYGDFNR